MYKNISLLILRVSFSVLMIVNHGLSKFLELWPFNDILIRDRDLFGLGSIFSVLLFVLGEFLAPILIAIGYKTRFFSIFPILTMFFAIVLSNIITKYTRILTNRNLSKFFQPIAVKNSYFCLQWAARDF